MYKFWKEYNANLFNNKFVVYEPDRNTIFKELVNKCQEKCQMIDVIFNRNKRQQYLENKGKSIPCGTPELVVKQKIGTRVIVDLLQLIKDLRQFFGKNITLKKHNILPGTVEDTKFLLNNAISIMNTDTYNAINQMYNATAQLSILLELNLDDLEIERQKVEEKEGSFLKGKIVKLDD